MGDKRRPIVFPSGSSIAQINVKAKIKVIFFFTIQEIKSKKNSNITSNKMSSNQFHMPNGPDCFDSV